MLLLLLEKKLIKLLKRKGLTEIWIILELKRMFAKYLTAIVSAIFIFFASFLLLGLGLSVVLPNKWTETYINLGLLSGNIPSILSAIIAAIAATYTFKASLHAKTGKLYRKNSMENNIEDDKK